MNIDQNTRIVIDSRADPNILSQVKDFWDHPYSTMEFQEWDPQFIRNNVIIYTEYSVKKLFAGYNSGDGRLLGLPTQYNYYFIRMGGEASLNTADFDYIFQWKNLTTFSLETPDGNVGNYFNQHMNELATLNQLDEMTFNVVPKTYQQLQVLPFLEQLPSLKYITIVFNSIKNKEMRDYVVSQNIPRTWYTMYGVDAVTLLKQPYLTNDVDTVIFDDAGKIVSEETDDDRE